MGQVKKLVLIYCPSILHQAVRQCHGSLANKGGSQLQMILGLFEHSYNYLDLLKLYLGEIIGHPHFLKFTKLGGIHISNALVAGPFLFFIARTRQH